MFPRSSFDGSTPEEANTAGGKQGQWRGRSRRRPFELERNPEKSYADLSSISIVSP